MPVDIEGMIGMICRRTRRPGKLRLDRSQFATLTAHHHDDGQTIGRVFTIHRAGAFRDGMQCCEECGRPLVVYREPIGRDDAWYATGSLVALVDFWSSYLAKLPLNPMREQRCFERPS